MNIETLTYKKTLLGYDGLDLISIFEDENKEIVVKYWIDRLRPDVLSAAQYSNGQGSVERAGDEGIDLFAYIPISNDVFELVICKDIDLLSMCLSNEGMGYLSFDDKHVEHVSLLEYISSALPSAGVFLCGD